MSDKSRHKNEEDPGGCHFPYLIKSVNVGRFGGKVVCRITLTTWI